jgi:anti-sigma factor ChrR (cupin superfamily)
MKRIVVVLFVLCLSGLLLAQAEKAPAKGKAGSAKTASHKEAKITTPDQLMWSPLMPGIEMAQVLGNPKSAGQFVIRLRATDDAKIPPHWHPTDEYVTVLAGDFSAGMGRTWDDAQLKTAPVHTAAMMPARMPHYAQLKKGAEVQVNGAGPFVINYVNPADDPNKKK